MYSMVLMAALTTAPDAPQFNGFFRDLFNGSSSCNGSCHGNCTGTSAASGSSCSGSCHGSCHGSCCGGHGFLGIRDFFAGLGDRGSCNGSCHGSCTGSCHGSSCTGTRPDRDYASNCHGGGCTGSVYAGTGCCGGSGYGFPPMSVPGVSMPPGGWNGDLAQPIPVQYGNMFDTGGACCGGSTPGAAAPYTEYPSIPSPGVPMVPRMMPGTEPFSDPARPTPASPSVGEERGRSTQRNYTPTMADGTRGTVVVKLPVDARLFAEGQPLAVTDGEKRFVTPPLPSDRDAVYTFRIEYTRNGDTLAQSKKVNVRAGATVTLNFEDLTARDGTPPKVDDLYTVKPPAADLKASPETRPTLGSPVASTSRPVGKDVATVLPPKFDDAAKAPTDRAKITVKLPAGAVLYVDGGKNEKDGQVREFTTPPLQAGKSYAYLMKVELTRNGLPEYQERRVDFRAGESHTVDFTSWATSTDRASR